MGRLPVVAGLLGLVLVTGLTWFAMWEGPVRLGPAARGLVRARERAPQEHAPITLPPSERYPGVEAVDVVPRAARGRPELRRVEPLGRPDAVASDVVATGRVLVDDAGTLADTSVVLFDALGRQRGSVEPQDDGTFALRHGRPLAAGWTVAAEIAGERALVGDATAPQPEHHPGQPPLDCVLRPAPAPRLIGRVSDALNGRLLADAEVVVGTRLPAWRDMPEDTATDRDGAYALRLDAFPPRDLYAWVRAEGYQARILGPFDMPPGDVRVEDFALAPAARVHGRVVSEATGHGLPDADVVLTSPHFALAEDRVLVGTDADGAFTIDAGDLPLGDALLCVRAEDHEPRLVSAPRDGGEVVVALRAPYRIEGRVLDARNGAPLPGVVVEVVPAFQWTWDDEAESDRGFTRGDGRFAVRPYVTPSGEAVVRVVRPGYLPYQSRLELVGAPGADARGRLWLVDVRLEPLP